MKIAIDSFNKRLTEAESKVPAEVMGREETDEEIERRLKEMRGARAKEMYGPARTDSNSHTYADLWDEVTDEEIDFELRKHLEVPPERRYQLAKKYPPYHEIGWTSRHIHNESTGWVFDPNRKHYVRIPGYFVDKGCTKETGCVPDCRFYPETGRIEDDELVQLYEKWKRDRDSITLEEKREARQKVHNYMLIYDDDTPEQAKQRYQKYLEYNNKNNKINTI